MEILCSTGNRVTYQATNDSAHVEDHPEPRDVATLGLFRWVGHHDGSLSAPQETCAHTEPCSGKGSEAQVPSVVVRQVGCHVDGITNAAKRQSSADAELVGKSTRKETHYGESRVQGGVRLVVRGGVELATTAHTVKRIEHARAHEADKGHDDKLHGWRGEPGQFAAKDGEGLVFPARGQLQGAALHRVLGRGSLLRNGCLLVGRHVVGD